MTEVVSIVPSSKIEIIDLNNENPNIIGLVINKRYLGFDPKYNPTRDYSWLYILIEVDCSKSGLSKDLFYIKYINNFDFRIIHNQKIIKSIDSSFRKLEIISIEKIETSEIIISPNKITLWENYKHNSSEKYIGFSDIYGITQPGFSGLLFFRTELEMDYLKREIFEFKKSIKIKINRDIEKETLNNNNIPTVLCIGEPEFLNIENQ